MFSELFNPQPTSAMPFKCLMRYAGLLTPLSEVDQWTFQKRSPELRLLLKLENYLKKAVNLFLHTHKAREKPYGLSSG
ncbi:hypothetical protein CEXT_310731 [Caerostris extrusa]|uniref:Uncharacterized protein n=1 Tax=Caerostris extrusa TaxID=172846 RepID=A0AAV4WR74_CAEEX|nr:hypothetical protein CEXT_310731 [Caerostris extrusa]